VPDPLGLVSDRPHLSRRTELATTDRFSACRAIASEWHFGAVAGALLLP